MDAFVQGWFEAGGNVLVVDGNKPTLCSKRHGMTLEELERKLETVCEDDGQEQENSPIHVREMDA